MKTSWQQTLKDRVKYLQEENFRLNQQLAMQIDRVKFLERFAGGPPTIMIACEKIVEAATQLTCSATAMIDKARRT